jgi:hypothetical protein
VVFLWYNPQKPTIMAGAKETPRQKMIGMMYLVLTALLALNVSKTILDAFVAIEENIQVASSNEYLRGEEKLVELKGTANDNTVLPKTREEARKLLMLLLSVQLKVFYWSEKRVVL